MPDAAPLVRWATAPVQGRYLVRPPRSGRARFHWIGFHGYAQAAEAMFEPFARAARGDDWLVASVQGLHAFYAGRSNEVVASWMTRQDRELAIASNVAYVNEVVEHLGHGGDERGGRRSGLLTPNFGIAELFRNRPSYRRSVSNIGYFFAINDYKNAEASFDWRSGARSTSGDPGFVRGNVEYRYRWLNRFITGETAVSYLAQRDGTKNTSITWNHNQDFSKQTRLTARINLVQNTQVQRATTINPVAANATIRSDLTYQTRVGPAMINLGGNRTQYPGRSQVDQNFPSLSVSTGALGKGFVTWTTALRLS